MMRLLAPILGVALTGLTLDHACALASNGLGSGQAGDGRLCLLAGGAVAKTFVDTNFLGDKEIGSRADTAAAAEISNGLIRLRVHLPNAQDRFYRGTRFDWSGIIEDLEYAGHNYYPRWFQRTDDGVLDFIYAGADIVAGPCTAVTGPVEEFSSNGTGLGFTEAKAGETFVKIGVGVLRKPDDAKYSPYRLYPIQDGGKWTVLRKPDSVEFNHELADPSTGYAYVYRKTVSVASGKPQMVIDHSLRNTGKRPIQTSVYNHNFLYLDRQPPSPDFVLTFPFGVRATPSAASNLAEIQGNQVTFSRTLAGEDSVYLPIQGFGAEAKDYDIRVENRRLGAGLRITADRPLARLALWSIRASLSIEPFISMNIEPGTDFTWRITYDYFTVPKAAN